MCENKDKAKKQEVDLWNVKEKQFSFSAYHIRRKDD
jgi:hypothetical protein